MASTFYDVDITVLTGATNGDGFIDNKKIENYMAEGSNPTNKAASIAKERGNARYEQMIGMLGMMANLYVTNIETDATASTPGTAFGFRLQSEHGDDCLASEGLTGAAAIKRVIARSFLVAREDFGDYFDPTASTSTNDATLNTSVPRFGIRIERILIGALAANLAAAEAAITVTKVT